MFRLLAKYILALLLSAGLAGVGIRSGISANVKNKLAAEETSIREVLTATPVPTLIPTPRMENKPEATPEPEEKPTGTPACEPRGNSVEEMHESQQAQQHEMEDTKSCPEGGNTIEEQHEANQASQMENETSPEVGEGSVQVENPSELQAPTPSQNFMQPQNDLGSRIRMLVRDFESGFGR